MTVNAEGQVGTRGFDVGAGQQDLYRRVLVGGRRDGSAGGRAVHWQHVDQDRAVVSTEVAVVDAEAEAVCAAEAGVGCVAHGARDGIKFAQYAVQRASAKTERQRVAVGVDACEVDDKAGGFVGRYHRVGGHRQLVAGAVDREAAQVVTASDTVVVTVEQIAGGIEDAQRAGQAQPVVALGEHAVGELQRQVGFGE